MLLSGPGDVDGDGVAGTTVGNWEGGGVACSKCKARNTSSMAVPRHSMHESWWWTFDPSPEMAGCPAASCFLGSVILSLV